MQPARKVTPALKAQTFSSIDLFAALTDHELEELCARAVAKPFAAGKALFHEGEACAALWVLAEGSVKLVKTTPSGRQVVLAALNAPCTIAEVPVFDGGAYPATVVATQPVTALVIQKRDFLQVCRSNPEVTLKFLTIFGKRLRQLVMLVEAVTFGSMRRRLAQEILGFADAAGSSRFQFPETHEEIAVRLGTVREVVSRNLGRFQAEGILTVKRREIEILNRAALEAEASAEL